MKFRFKYLFVAFFTLCFVKTFSQVDDENQSKQAIIEQRIELISENLEDEDIDLNTLLDNLFHYFDHPINLNNKAAPEKLREIGLLTEVQINNLAQHIQINGKLLSIYELQSVQGFDVLTIKNILPFVKVTTDLDAPTFSVKEITSEGEHELITRWQNTLEKQSGFTKTDQEKIDSPNSYYLGSSDKLYMRYRFRYLNNVSFGVTSEKDPGEEFFKGTQTQGFDFYSAHFYLGNFKHFKSIAIGDYQAQFGQGLTLWSGLAFGKSVDIASIKRNAQGIRPYASVDESRFMRGAAVAYEWKDFTITALASQKKIDANILEPDTLVSDDDIFVSSFQQTGFHRTNSELLDKHALTETHLGGNIAYNNKAFHIGATAIKTKFSGELSRSPSNYNQFDFNGTENHAIGVDYNWVYRNINFFGESSQSANGSLAHVHGALLALDPKLNVSVSYRDFDRGFQNLVYNPFAESSTAKNEQGFLVGFDLKLSNSVSFTGYFDQFEFEWMRYQTDKPLTNGYDFIGQLRYKPNKKLDIYARYRYRNKPINADAENIENIPAIFYEERENYRLNIDYKISEDWQVRTRVEQMNYERIGGALEKGFMLYQDVFYNPKGKKYSIKARYALFDTDSYNARIYAYESDLLYVFSVPAYYNRGSRAYLMLRYKFNKKFDLWLRISRWMYDNQDVISSGLSEIEDNTKTEMKAQLIIKL
ncbi:MAG: hypothetical protein ACLGGV_03690 [Bacteroidia bacterium]